MSRPRDLGGFSANSCSHSMRSSARDSRSRWSILVFRLSSIAIYRNNGADVPTPSGPVGSTRTLGALTQAPLCDLLLRDLSFGTMR
jgi:hypothetical protein